MLSGMCHGVGFDGDWSRCSPLVGLPRTFCSLQERLWRAIVPTCVNVREQDGHLKGLSPVCVRRWHRRVSRSAKVLEQMLHSNGLSPVCIFM